MRKFFSRLIPHSTTTRLVALSSIVAIMVVSVVVVQVVRVFEQHYLSIESQDLTSELTEFQAAEVSRPPNESAFDSTESYLRFHPALPGHIIIVSFFGHPYLGTTGARSIFELKAVRAILKDPASTSHLSRVALGDTPYLLVTSPLIDGSKTVGYYFGFDNLSSFANQVGQVIFLTVLEGAVTLIFAILSGYILLRRVMSTVGEATDTALQIAGGDLDQRLPPSATSDELAKLAEAFNLMISKLQATLAAERQLLADVSHQLRTPLTVLRGNVELLEVAPPTSASELSETVGILLEEIEYMSSLVDRLLYLERLSLPQYLSLEETDLRSFLYDLYSAARMLGERQWKVGDVPDMTLIVDQSSLRGALLNLADNAFKATQESDRIEFGARLSPNGEFVQIFVSDDGKGIPKDQLESVFNRFETSSALTSRGAGLGLTIVKATAEAHGGHTEMRSVEGEGTTVELWIPIGEQRVGSDLEPTVGEEDLDDDHDASRGRLYHQQLWSYERRR